MQVVTIHGPGECHWTSPLGILLQGDITTGWGIILTSLTELKAKCWCYNLFIKVNFFLQVLLAMHANVEDRGNKGDITPLMAAASGGYVDIVKLLLVHCADVNAQSSTGNWEAGTWRINKTGP